MEDGKSDKAMSIDIAYRFGNSYCSIERERWAKAKRTTAITTRVTPSFSCVSTDLSALAKKWFDPKSAWNRWLLSSLPEYDLLIASPNQGPKSELMILHGSCSTEKKGMDGWTDLSTSRYPVRTITQSGLRSRYHLVWQSKRTSLNWALHQSPGHRLSNLPDSINITS
jgi:hypothetical protein